MAKWKQDYSIVHALFQWYDTDSKVTKRMRVSDWGLDMCWVKAMDRCGWADRISLQQIADNQNNQTILNFFDARRNLKRFDSYLSDLMSGTNHSECFALKLK